LVPTGDWSDNAVDSERECWDGNLGKVRVYDAFAFGEQNVKPIVIDVQTICAVFSHVAEKLACLALSTWACSVVVVAFWFFLAVTQSAYVFRTQMAGW
jgi:hypothetical protein